MNKKLKNLLFILCISISACTLMLNEAIRYKENKNNLTADSESGN